MIKSIHFKNFKALRDTTLDLGRFTLVGGIHVEWPKTGGYKRGHPGMRSVPEQEAREATRPRTTCSSSGFRIGLTWTKSCTTPTWETPGTAGFWGECPLRNEGRDPQ